MSLCPIPIESLIDEGLAAMLPQGFVEAVVENERSRLAGRVDLIRAVIEGLNTGLSELLGTLNENNLLKKERLRVHEEGKLATVQDQLKITQLSRNIMELKESISQLEGNIRSVLSRHVAIKKSEVRAALKEVMLAQEAFNKHTHQAGSLVTSFATFEHTHHGGRGARYRAIQGVDRRQYDC
jgi:hypothetical protein